jgi:hypothetical protein
VNTNDCNEIKDLYDDSETYIRTVCIVNIDKTHDAADKYCLSNGMSLFMLEPPEATKALLNFANTQYPPGRGYYLHVDGKTSEGCTVLYNGKGLFEVYSDFCNSQYTRPTGIIESGEFVMPSNEFAFSHVRYFALWTKWKLKHFKFHIVPAI